MDKQNNSRNDSSQAIFQALLLVLFGGFAQIGAGAISSRLGSDNRDRASAAAADLAKKDAASARVGSPSRTTGSTSSVRSTTGQAARTGSSSTLGAGKTSTPTGATKGGAKGPSASAGSDSKPTITGYGIGIIEKFVTRGDKAEDKITFGYDAFIDELVALHGSLLPIEGFSKAFTIGDDVDLLSDNEGKTEELYRALFLNPDEAGNITKLLSKNVENSKYPLVNSIQDKLDDLLKSPTSLSLEQQKQLMSLIGLMEGYAYYLQDKYGVKKESPYLCFINELATFVAKHAASAGKLVTEISSTRKSFVQVLREVVENTYGIFKFDNVGKNVTLKDPKQTSYTKLYTNALDLALMLINKENQIKNTVMGEATPIAIDRTTKDLNGFLSGKYRAFLDKVFDKETGKAISKEELIAIGYSEANEFVMYDMFYQCSQLINEVKRNSSEDNTKRLDEFKDFLYSLGFTIMNNKSEDKLEDKILKWKRDEIFLGNLSVQQGEIKKLDVLVNLYFADLLLQYLKEEAGEQGNKSFEGYTSKSEDYLSVMDTQLDRIVNTVRINLAQFSIPEYYLLKNLKDLIKKSGYGAEAMGSIIKGFFAYPLAKAMLSGEREVFESILNGYVSDKFTSQQKDQLMLIFDETVRGVGFTQDRAEKLYEALDRQIEAASDKKSKSVLRELRQMLELIDLTDVVIFN